MKLQQETIIRTARYPNQKPSRSEYLTQLESIYRHSRKYARQMATSLSFDSNDVDDALQDLFLSFLSQPFPDHALDNPGYLRRALHRDLIDITRKRRRSQMRVARLADRLRCNAYLSSAPKNHPGYQITLSEQYRLVAQTIQSDLPSQLATALQLRYQQNLNHCQIARHMKIKQASARRYVCIALQKLRQKLYEKLGDTLEPIDFVP